MQETRFYRPPNSDLEIESPPPKESNILKYLIWIIAAIQVVGGTLNIISALPFLAEITWLPSILVMFTLLTFINLITIYIGIKLFQCRSVFLRLSIIVLLLQIPQVILPEFSYNYYTGFALYIGFYLDNEAFVFLLREFFRIGGQTLFGFFESRKSIIQINMLPILYIFIIYLKLDSMKTQIK